MQLVTTYRGAYAPINVALCDHHADTYDEIPLGPAVRGSHKGLCDVCNRLDLEFEAAEIRVNDGRGFVRGARVRVRYELGEWHEGSVIPPSGGDPSSWISNRIHSLAIKIDVLGVLAAVADDGAAGRSGATRAYCPRVG